ncbi:MAG TPA: hypothetical protein VMH05_13895 [Bryobacteraceae bacterium]|nr:hypothetical protein [Bryobacteraceae bacterium]
MRALAAVALCLALAGCQPKKPGLLHIDPALESLVPQDTVFVAGANLDAIRDTTVYRELLSRAPLPQLDDFARQTGLDPRKDLSQILSCSNGKRGLLMARGKFNRKDLEARLEQQGAKPISYKNHRLFGNENQAIMFLSDSTAVAGPTPDLRSILDGRTKGGLPAPLRDLLRTLPPSDQIYAALNGSLSGLNIAAPENSNLANIMQALRSVNSATLGMDLSNGLQLMAAVTCNTERDAKFVHDLLKGIIGLGRLNTPDNQPEMLKLYDAIQVTQKQTRTEVQANISQDQANKFLDLWLKR